MLPSIIQSLGNISSDEAVKYLEEFARSDNESLRNEAELALIAVHPPAAGLLVTYTAPNSQAETAGMKRGDIIVSYNGQAVKDLEALREEMNRTGGDSLVTVMVNRKGEMIPLTIKGSKIGINGKAVAPK
ncbi:MAG: PDZ domain-containing protein [Planctomycetes bacterium]|nr:PDZ domain-containing protein [Planctomycetota bacterium]